MSKPKIVLIKETLTQLKGFQKKASALIAPRIYMLVVEKENAATGISRRSLAARIGVDPNSITNWRKMYEKGGIELIQNHQKKGFKRSVFSAQVHKAIENKLKDSKNGLRGYTELLTFIETEFNEEFKYNTLLKYCVKNFNSKIKTARKSHVNKNEQAVKTFKKTLAKTVKSAVLKKKATTKA